MGNAPTIALPTRHTHSSTHPDSCAAMVSNAALVYKKPPTGAPVPGETLQRVVDDNFDPDTVPLNGGILVKTKALSLDPYMRGRLRAPKVKSYNQPFQLDKTI